MATKNVRLTLMKSLNRRTEKTRASVRGLGLRGIRSSVIVPLTPENEGMIKKTSYLLKIEEVA